MTRLLTKSLPLLAILLGTMAQAQAPFWTETFTSGVPAGWTNVDASGQNVTWQWCPQPSPTPACAPVFSGQQPFQATTAGTGFVHVDSDGGGPVPNHHVSRLTTVAINCTGKSQVWLQFQSHIGTYTEPLDTNAIVRVSTNLSTWTKFTPFPGLNEDNYFSPNPYFSLLDISSVAANQTTVYIQFQWRAKYEYMWDLDDVALFDENPAPAHDLSISDFFYPASSLEQPASQIATDTFAFGAWLSNLGSKAQTKVVLRVGLLTNANVEFWADSLLIPSIAIGVTDSFFELPNRYAPALPVGTYFMRYTLRADSVDARPADNVGIDPFLVTDNIFSKEAQVQTAIRPQTLGTVWYVGNLYQMSAGSLDNYVATRARFTYTSETPEIPIKDVEADVYLFRVKDGVNLSTSSFDRTKFFSPSLDWVGLAHHSAPDTMVAGIMQEVQLLDIVSGLSNVALDKGARYLIAVGYPGASKFVYHAFNEDVSMFFPSTFTFSDRWYPNGFGVDANAVLRLFIALATTTDNTPLPETSMRIMPNPVQDAVNLAVNFDKPTDATITIADMTGRVIVVQDREGLTGETLSYPVPQLAAGTYLARIATAEGTLTKKFVKL